MCGVAGIFSLTGKPIHKAEERIWRITSMLKHRGPDSQGVYVSEDRAIAVGNTRLAIVDPLNTAKQPLETADGKCILSFNGEIYNYLDLREMLQQKGVRFRTRMDTEVLLEGLRLEGEDFLKRLDGMWTFAFYDTDKRSLLLSRDILGEKHLFYHVYKGELIFASEVRPLLIDADGHFEIDFDSFLTALHYFSAPPGRTMVKGIRRIFPGHNIAADAGGSFKQYRYRRLHPEKWFDFFNNEPSLDRVINVFEDTFQRTCRRRLPREVNYISTLSGGLDSTLICLYASDFGKTKIRTVYGHSSIKPPRKSGDNLDEYSASALTSKKLNTRHDQIYLYEDSYIPVLQRLADNAFDGMFDNGVVSFEMLARYGRTQNAKVMLMSEGPDEFLGYPKDLNAYRIDNMFLNHRMKYRILKTISSTSSGRYMLRRLGLKNSVISPHFSYEPFRFLPIHESWEVDTIDKMMTKDQFFSTSNYYGVMDPVYDDLISKMDYTQLRALSYASFSLPDMFNLRTDKAYMNASVEARLPYQPPEMVELMVAMPSRFRFNKGETTKYLLRKMVERYIGPEIAYRSKYGFGAAILLNPNVYKAMRYEEVIRESSIFNVFPFRHGTREFILRPENKDMLWPFYVLARTHDQLKKQKISGYAYE